MSQTTADLMAQLIESDKVLGEVSLQLQAVMKELQTVRDERDRLTQENNRLNSDAARWTYLRNRASSKACENHTVVFRFPWRSLTQGDPSTLDREIDAAIKAFKEPYAT